MRRRAISVTLVMSLVVRGAFAEPATEEPATSSDDLVSPGTANPPGPPRDYRVASGLGLTGAYVSLGTWMWFAWYKDQPKLPEYKFGGDGWFGSSTYAGGSDKLGHFWSNLMVSRLGTEVLRMGGWDSVPSSLIASGLCLAAFTLVEVNDGYYTEFSPSDLTANGLGALAAVAMSNWPALDNAIDFRVQWFPSAHFRRSPSPDVAEDYSGQTYLLAYKPRSVRAIREARSPVRLLGFVNPVLGFQSRNFKPAPPPGDTAPRTQTGFLGVTLDMQVIIATTLGGHSTAGARITRSIGHGLFEAFNLPYSTVPVVSVSRSRAAPGP
jgi:hypothetical protein